MNGLWPYALLSANNQKKIIHYERTRYLDRSIAWMSKKISLDSYKKNLEWKMQNIEQ